MTEFEQQLFQYRTSLLDLEQKMQASFDKAVMALSGGALGLSFTFLRDVAKANPLNFSRCLLAAWICWGLSVTCVLCSFLTSAIALRHATKQTYAKLIDIEIVGGRFNTITKYLNYAGGALFFLGLVFIVIFIGANMP